MPNKPPFDPRYAQKPDRAAGDDAHYVVDGQYLNQGHYETSQDVNPNYDNQPEYQDYQDSPGYHDQQRYVEQDLNQHDNDQGYLRKEFVQGNEYQQQHSQYEEHADEEHNHPKPNELDVEHHQNVGSIATFGSNEAHVTTAPTKMSPIIPRDTIIGKSILFIIIAMCFLAGLSIVSLLLVQSSVDGWTNDIGKQATVQIIPSPERDTQSDVVAALEIIRNTAGISQAEPLSKNETAKLLEPWIGDGIIGQDANNNNISILDELPIPAIIAIEFDRETQVDLAQLDINLKQNIPGISVDDHKKWLSHLSSIGNILKISAFAVLALVVAISITIIVFATDAALNSNKSSIEILFLVGAEESFITKEVRHHFLWMGLKAGFIGAIICIGFILLLGLMINIFYAAQFENLAAARILFGQITLSPYQYLYLLLVPLFSTIISATCVHLAAKRIINQMH